MGKTLRILIVDDQRRTRQSLKALLETKFQPMEILEAANGLEAAHCAEETQPQIVLMDARMPEMDGVEATRHIKAMAASTFVIVLSMYADYRAAAFAAGADEFVNKDESSERLLEAVTAAIDTLDR
jgi:two-component system response regulator AlgR